MKIYIITSGEIKEKLKDTIFRNEIAYDLGLNIGQHLDIIKAYANGIIYLCPNSSCDQIIFVQPLQNDWQKYFKTAFEEIETSDRVVHLRRYLNPESYDYENNIEINYCMLVQKEISVHCINSYF